MATRRSGGPAKATGPARPQGVEPVGTVRRSQLISTYGIGAVVDLEKGSYMPMGLDDWEGATSLPSLTVHEPRLEAQLGVSHFRLAPVVQPIKGTPLVEPRPTLPVVRFPEWHECPRCHRIGKEDDPFVLAEDLSRLRCQKCGTYATPVRFVVACRKGHIEDFPWVEWAHRDHKAGICNRPVLTLKSRGRSAALGDLYVQCNCGGSNSLANAFQPNATGKHCHGLQPWLFSREPGCTEEVRVLQRGASNVHFSVGASALSIPPVSDAVFQIIDGQWLVLSAIPPEAVDGIFRHLAANYDAPFDALRAAYRERKRLAEPSAEVTEGNSRVEEYGALSTDRDDEDVGGFKPQFCNSVSEPPDQLRPWFDLVGAVSRLREVRAVAGFTRIEPYPVKAERIALALLEGRVARLSKRPRNWLPASEIRGEGLFLRFDGEFVDRWITENPAVLARAAALDAVSAAIAAQRGYQRDYTITPRLLLVHSFAHALIRQISLDCGYSSAALRERLYVADATEDSAAMQGVLIYTGSPDSEGSLGGLVRLADPTLLSRIVADALQSAQWCGSDPVCLEADPHQAGERVSGAACHCCILVPETACEKFNRELDRTMLVGDAQGSWRGYFDGLGG